MVLGRMVLIKPIPSTVAAQQIDRKEAMSKTIKEQVAKHITKFAGKYCSQIVSGKVNQRTIKLGSGSTHTFEVTGITFTFSDGSKVEIDNFWGEDIRKLGELLILFTDFCKIFNSGCDHDMRTDKIQTI